MSAIIAYTKVKIVAYAFGIVQENRKIWHLKLADLKQDI